MSRKSWGVLLIVGGVLLGVIAALADVIRIGLVPGTFGFAQIGGLVVGVIAVAVGIYLVVKPAAE